MSATWPLKTLQELGVHILDCEHKTPKPFPDGHFRYVAIPDIMDGRIHTNNCRLISDDDFVEWTRRTRPVGGDLVITRRGRVGDTAPVPDGFECAIGQNLVIARAESPALDNRYFRWAAQSPIWSREVDRLTNVGAIFSSLNVRDIPKLRIPTPPIQEQIKIARILDSLEAKIDVNQQVISASDSLVQKHFRYLAQPILFSNLRFEDVASIGGGGTPSTSRSEYWGGDIPWATPTDVTALRSDYLFSTRRTLTSLGLANCSSQLYPVGSILMTSRATIGAFALTEVPTAVNQGFIVVNAKDKTNQLWLYHEMRSRVQEFISHANGATFLELSRGRFKSMPLRLADKQTVESFSAVASAIHSRASHAQLEVIRLAELRDGILPLLVSGSLRVRDGERLIEDDL